MSIQTHHTPDELIKNFESLDTSKPSFKIKAQEVLNEVEEILKNMEKGLDILRTVGKKPESSVLKNQEKLKHLQTKIKAHLS